MTEVDARARSAHTLPLHTLTPGLTKPLPTDPAQWSYRDAEDALGTLTPFWLPTAQAFIAGDHWQGGAAWIGPQLDQGEEGYSETMMLLQAGFTSRNVLVEVAERYRDGIVGFEPSWELVPRRPLEDDEEPKPEEQRLIDEAHAALTTWWDEHGVLERFAESVFRMAWASRGPLRLFVRSDAVVRGTDGRTAVPRQRDLEPALALVRVDTPDVRTAGVYVHPETQERIGLWLFEREGQKRCELSFRQKDGTAILRTLLAGETTPSVADVVLAALPTIEQMARARLLTDQAFQLQRALNLALSVVPRTIVTAGFLERILINAKLPGKWIDGPNGKVWQPADFVFGAGVTAALQGIEVESDDGKRTLTTPGVQWREPVAVTGTLEARSALYAALLEEVKQAHIVLAQEATPSGRSREEARADYASSLRIGKQAADRAGRWLIGAALSMAETLMQQPGKYTKTLRARFNCRLDTGPLSIAERTQNAQDWKDGLLSRETVMVRSNVEDPDAEVATIMQEPAAQLALRERQAEVMRAWMEAGASARLAGEIVGLEPALVAKLEKDLFPADDAGAGAPGAGGNRNTNDNGGRPAGDGENGERPAGERQAA